MEQKSELTSKVIDDEVEDMAANNAATPKRIRDAFLDEYRSKAEQYRKKINDALSDTRVRPVLGKPTLQGEIYSLMCEFRLEFEKTEKYSNYKELMEEQGIEPVSMEDFFHVPKLPRRGTSFSRRYSRHSGKLSYDPTSHLSISSRWEDIRNKGIKIGSKVRNSLSYRAPRSLSKRYKKYLSQKLKTLV